MTAGMRPRYSNEFLDRVYGGASVFDLWSLLTTLEKHCPLPDRSWLFCRLVEWLSATRSGVWTYYEATGEALLSRISVAARRYPALHEVSEQFDFGTTTWKSEQEIDRVDAWMDSHEQQIHSVLMQFAREEKASIIELNDGQQ